MDGQCTNQMDFRLSPSQTIGGYSQVIDWWLVVCYWSIRATGPSKERRFPVLTSPILTIEHLQVYSKLLWVTVRLNSFQIVTCVNKVFSFSIEEENLTNQYFEASLSNLWGRKETNSIRRRRQTGVLHHFLLTHVNEADPLRHQETGRKEGAASTVPWIYIVTVSI